MQETFFLQSGLSIFKFFSALQVNKLFASQ